MTEASDCRVLVTGGTGFLGAHCVLQLLNQGYKVKTTIRSMRKKDDLIAMLNRAGAKAVENLAIIEADLSNDANWDQAVQDCDYVLHVASPFPANMPKDENELIIPAVEGTLRVLKAASTASVKRVVLTSSFAAVGYSSEETTRTFTEEDWTDPNNKNISAYVKSKTLAEKAAWDFVGKDDNKIELAVICPRFILGPSLSKAFSTSLTVIKQLLDGALPALPNVSYGIVDVRDTADLHIRAMTDPQASGQRFLASSREPMTFLELALLIKEKFGEHGKKVPTRVFPNWVVRILALFNPAARGIVPNLGKVQYSDVDKAKRLLGWQPRSKEEAVIAAAECVLEFSGDR